jgi:hypothetical protein
MVKSGRLLILTVAVAALGMMAFAGAAQAASVNSLITYGSDNANAASDNNAEYLWIDNDGDGRLDADDVIIGAIDVNTLNSTSANVGGSSGNDQWAGVFALQVRAIINISNANTATETGDIVFQPWGGFSAFLASLNGGSGPSDNPALPTGTIVRLWTNSTITSNFTDENNDGTDTAFESVATAATGSYYWDLGFSDSSAASHVSGGVIVSSNGEGWVARNGGTNIVGLMTEASDNTLGIGNFAMSLLGRGLGPDVGYRTLSATRIGILGGSTGDSAQVSGTSTVRGAADGEDDGGFHAGSDTNFGFVAVPLPGAALSGIAMLLGLGFVQVRRRRKI